ncbi:MAG: bifunctional diguanylate cyclase/phosphodiesterase [Xanthobacteraceae bacterium]|nr:bifunctional diguanylate cyclase/phosphodiesterase [Xanthobacteraceae bacterium]
MIGDERIPAIPQTTHGEPGGAAPGAAPDPAAILASIRHAVYDWDITSDALVWSANAAEVLAVSAPATIATGRGYAHHVQSCNDTTRYDVVMTSTARDEGAGVPYQLEYRLCAGGERDCDLWLEDTGRWFAGPDGRPARAHGLVRVINERRAHDERLSYLAQFDSLTGELNRNALTDALAAAFDEATRFRSSCGFLLIGIDGLARINESYDFSVADEVIAAVARRIRSRMRGADLFGRYSGNKFGVVMKNCTPDDLAPAAERFLAAVRDDVVETSVGPVAVTISIGGVAAPRHARSIQEILSRAQEALDVAKMKRQGSFQAYRPNVERDAMRKENLRVTDEIVTALNERRILIAYEPVVATVTRVPAFHECLMRIRRADGTLAAAGTVIPVAERLGLVRLIDHRVLGLVTEQLAGTPALRASLNVSPASIGDPDWWGLLDSRLRANQGIAERLVLEITETAAIQDLGETTGFVRRAKDLGCRIAIDDFGAGYTSFRNLRKLGVDMIKIDGAFVQNLPRSEDDRAFVRTLIDLGRSLGLATVAEWVQDEEAARMLADWGCDYLQGALIGRASLMLPPSDGDLAASA